MKRVLASLLLTLGTLAVGMPAWAERSLLPLPQPKLEQQLMHAPPPRRELISSSEAVRQAREAYPGKVLSVRLRNQDSGQPFYAVKIIKKGKVRVVRVPAQR